MSKFYTAILVSVILLCIVSEASAQQISLSPAKKQELLNFSQEKNRQFSIGYQRALALAKAYKWPIRRKTKTGGVISLQGVNSLGFPVYLKTDNNTTAAATTGTNTVQPGGSLGLNLSGSSTVLDNKLAIWDGGSVFKFHQEFAGKTITLHDSAGIIDHATHVSGTMIAKGIYPPARGMSFNAKTLQSYDFDNDVAEMSAAAAGLLLSNHSYGDEAGWNLNDLTNNWEWYGLPGDTVDYTFGFYNDRTQAFDKIAFNAPNYLIVESAGNARAENGPPIGADYYGYQSRTNQTIVDKGPRPATISSNNGYDIISTTGNAKNILTVGAVDPLPYGPVNSGNISISYFSSWGPTDDGRVKPDIVGDGVDVLSTGITSTTSYLTLSGTSMAAPNITGSLYLLQEYYEQRNSGAFMRSATLKGLACHTAFDAGNIGPDYIYGWGLLDMKKAAQAITDNGIKSLLKENTLQQGQTQTYNAVASGDGPLIATISWTDPAGSITPDGTVNSRTPKLVNDLDIRVSDGTTTFTPWILDPANPSLSAKNGDNKVDNVEQVFVPGAVPGKAYTITVTNKGALTGGAQDYSLIVTGMGGIAYCISTPLSTADSKINNVTLSNVSYTSPAGCTNYTDLTNLTIQLEQGKTYPLTITLGTCGANFNKAAKVFIDWNGNGVFDANELVATTGIINGTGTSSSNIAVPITVQPGNYALMRVVLNETGDTSSIKACGSYGKGETQDYRVQFLQTGSDAGVTAIINPLVNGSCPEATQVIITLKNFGSKVISNVPFTVKITAPDNTITTLAQTYTGSLAPFEQENVILNSSFNAVAGAAYTITATTNLANDPIITNNQVTQVVTITSPPTAANLSAYYCVNSKQYQLSGSGDGALFWYQNIGDTLPLAFGSPALVSQAPVNNTYYAGLNDFKGIVGPAAKTAFSGGGYNQFTPAINVSTKVPVIIESARLYIGNSGKITFNVANTDGQIVSTTTIAAVATRTIPLPGVQPDDPADQGAIYPLNLSLPAAGNYTITAVYDSTATIYRNNVGVTGYPFTLGNIFSITGNDVTFATDTAAYKDYYYYFYNMQVKSAGCQSVNRVPVSLITPTITQNGNVLSSNFASGNQWYADGLAIIGANGVTYTPSQSGNYTVGITEDSGCQLLSANFIFVLFNNNSGSDGIGLNFYPIPASTVLHVIFASPVAGNLNMSLINVAGKTEYSSSQVIAKGNFSSTVNVTPIPPGTYVMKVSINQTAYKNKIIITR